MKEQKILLETGTNEMELLTVFVNEQPFGMNVAKVQPRLQGLPVWVMTLQSELFGYNAVVKLGQSKFCHNEHFY